MALTSADLDALDAAIASGELRVSVNDRTVEYRSIDDLLRARDHVARIVAAAGQPLSAGPRYRVASFSDA
jgi:hypothetical protein